MNALASLNSPNEAGDMVWQGYERGRALRREDDARKADAAYRGSLAALATDPENAQARAHVMSVNPELGMKIQDYADGRAFKGALGSFLASSNVSTLAGLGAPTPANSGPNALAVAAGLAPSPPPASVAPSVAAPAAQGQSFDQAFAPFDQTAPQGTVADPAAAQGGETAGPDLSMLGQPQTDEDRAFLAMLQRDPIKALEIRSTLRENFVTQLKAERDVYALGVDVLSRAQDQAGWQAALGELAPRVAAIGADILKKVPANYPGPDGVKHLLEQAMPVKERMDYLLREANIEADNERADLNTDSLIDTRDRRAAEYERANRAREGNQRRGQDMTDRRSRERPSRRSSGNKPSAPVKVDSPQEAAKLSKGTRYQTPDGEVYVR